MLKRSYARLMVALFAAITLHALLLIKADDSTLTIATDSSSSLLQVALMPKQLDRSSKLAVFPEQGKKAALEPVNQATDLPENQESIPSVKQLPDSVETKLVPEDIQATILAHVSYPRQARRLGWEGEAEFRLDVHNRSVQQVTMLGSTGHSILDRAAHLGILSAGPLALNNGSYRLPVVFRLQ